MALLFAFATTMPACSTWSDSPPAAAYRHESIERPASSLGDEDSAADKVGKALVAGLVVCIALAAIVLPILLFT